MLRKEKHCQEKKIKIICKVKTNGLYPCFATQDLQKGCEKWQEFGSGFYQFLFWTSYQNLTAERQAKI